MIGSPRARVLALAALGAWPRGPQADERADRLATAELLLRGPASAIVIEVPGAGRAFIDARVPAGASARFDVALPANGRSFGAAAHVALEGGGSAELEPRASADGERRARYEALPRGLRSRAPIAPPEAAPPAPAPAALLLVAGLFAAGWALRRRAAASLALGMGGAALVLFLVWKPTEELEAFTVAEGQGPVPAFLLVESARERLFIGDLGGDLGDLLRLETRPSGAELTFRGPPGGSDLWIEAPGATLFALRDGTGLAAGRGRNGVFDLQRTWLRESGAAGWTALGPWLRGAPLPRPPTETGTETGPGASDSAGEPADPPGWLVAGLPQGVGAVVGGGGRRWMRWADLPEGP